MKKLLFIPFILFTFLITSCDPDDDEETLDLVESSFYGTWKYDKTLLGGEIFDESDDFIPSEITFHSDGRMDATSNMNSTSSGTWTFDESTNYLYGDTDDVGIESEVSTITNKKFIMVGEQGGLSYESYYLKK